MARDSGPPVRQGRVTLSGGDTRVARIALTDDSGRITVDDLPSGARRLVQRTRGIAATVVNGEVLLREGKHTGALPGQLLRGPAARRS